jgi:DNA-binding Xre family transcriptional regulator
MVFDPRRKPVPDETRKPTARGRPAVVRPAAFRWLLPELMAQRGMRSTVELGPLLAERGVVLSDAQVYRLVSYVPERLSLKTLSALCDIFGCTPSDVVQTFVEAKGRRKTASQRGGEPEAASLPRNFAPTKAQVLTRTRRT